MTLYLGIPNEEWNLHMSEAEELLVEDDIGTHILGIYPYGDRLYGDESGAPGLLCIYFNDPTELLNPCIQDIGHHSRSIGQGCGPVRYVSLYAWVKTISLLNHPSDEFYRSLCHLIPSMSMPLYEDPQLTKLVDLARDYLSTRGWDQPSFLPNWPRKGYEYNYIKYLRMRLVLEDKGVFAPCLNKNWCARIEPLQGIRGLSEDVLNIDSNFIAYCNKEIDDPGQGLDLLGTELRVQIHKRLEFQKAEKEREALGKAVESLYESLL